jgi:hypothetical protein
MNVRKQFSPLNKLYNSVDEIAEKKALLEYEILNAGLSDYTYYTVLSEVNWLVRTLDIGGYSDYVLSEQQIETFQASADALNQALTEAIAELQASYHVV